MSMLVLDVGHLRLSWHDLFASLIDKTIADHVEHVEFFNILLLSYMLLPLAVGGRGGCILHTCIYHVYLKPRSFQLLSEVFFQGPRWWNLLGIYL